MAIDIVRIGLQFELLVLCYHLKNITLYNALDSFETPYARCFSKGAMQSVLWGTCTQSVGSSRDLTNTVFGLFSIYFINVLYSGSYL